MRKRLISLNVLIMIFILFSQNLAIADPILPITKITPGAINLAVTQSNISTTICKSGWTATIRPSSSYTSKLKKGQLSGTYSYYSNKVMGDYEEDHLISLQLGGSPTSVKNLWPQPYAGSIGARAKDQVETKLKRLICAGKITLKTAQLAIASNWYQAYLQYIKKAQNK